MLQSMGLQRVGQDLETGQQQQGLRTIVKFRCLDKSMREKVVFSTNVAGTTEYPHLKELS